MYLLFWTYCPRDADFFNQTDREAFKIWFHAEVCEAAQHEAWFVFNLSYMSINLRDISTTPSAPPCYKITSTYHGNTCVPDDELIPAMQGSPFYKSFSGIPPFSSDHSSPPSSHDYNSDYSFD